MSNAKQIIGRFGGQSALAALLGKRQSTVQHWASTGRIPSQWHHRLLELARRHGVSLEPKDFVATVAPGIGPAGGKLGVLLVGLGAAWALGAAVHRPYLTDLYPARGQFRVIGMYWAAVGLGGAVPLWVAVWQEPSWATGAAAGAAVH